jgi:hypothetical protein
MFQQNYKNKYLKYKLKYLDLKYGGAHNLDELGLTVEEKNWYDNYKSNLKNNEILKEITNRDTFIKKIKLRNKLEEDLKNEEHKLDNDAKSINMSQGFIKSTIQRIQKNKIRINIELKYIRTNYYNYNNLSSFEQEQLIEEEFDKQLLKEFKSKTIQEIKDFDDITIENIKERIKTRKEIKKKKELVRNFFVELFYYLKKHNNCFKTGTLVFEDNNNKLYNLLTFGIISNDKDCKKNPIAQQNYFINKYKEVFKNKEVKSNDECFKQGSYLSSEYIRGCRNNMCLTLELTFNQGVNDLCDKHEKEILRSCVYYKFDHNNRQYIFLKLLNENETEYHETYERNERIEDPSKKYPSEEKDNNFYKSLGKNFYNINNIEYYNEHLRTGNEMFITEELKNHCIDFEIYDSEIDNSDSEVFSTIDSKNEEDPGKENSDEKDSDEEDSEKKTGEETGEDSGEDSGEETEKNSSSKKKKRENQQHRQRRIKREKKAREIAEQEIVERERAQRE